MANKSQGKIDINNEKYRAHVEKTFGTKQPSGSNDPEFVVENLILSSMAATAWGKKILDYHQVPQYLNNKEGLYFLVKDIKESMGTSGFKPKSGKPVLYQMRDFLKGIYENFRNSINNKAVGNEHRNKEIITVETKGDIKALKDLINYLSDPKNIKNIDATAKGLSDDVLQNLQKIVSFLEPLNTDKISDKLDKIGICLNGITALLSLRNLEDNIDEVEENIDNLKEFVTKSLFELLSTVSDKYKGFKFKILNEKLKSIEVSLYCLGDLTNNLPGFMEIFKAEIKTIYIINYAKNIAAVMNILSGIKTPKALDVKLSATQKIVQSILDTNNQLKNISIKDTFKISYAMLLTISALKSVFKKLDKLNDISNLPLCFEGFKETLENFQDIFDTLKKSYDEDLVKLDAAVGVLESFAVLLGSIDTKAFDDENTKAIIDVLEGNGSEILLALSENGTFGENLQSIVMFTDADIEKFDNIIKAIEKLSKLSNVIISAKITEVGFEALEKGAYHIHNIIDSFNKVKEDDLKKLENSINLMMKVVFMSGAILLLGAVVMKFINPLKLVLFTATLGLFVGGLILVFSVFKKGIDASFDTVESLMKLVAMSAFILLFSGFIAQYIDFVALFGFTLMLSGFIFMIVGTYALFNKHITNTFDSAKDFALLIMVSAGTLLLGSLLYNYINYKDVIGFALSLAGFMFLILSIYSIFNITSKGAYKGAKDFLIIMGVSAFILILGSYLYDVIEWDKAFLFGGGLLLFTLGIIGIWYLASKISKGAFKGAKEFAILLGVSAFLLIFGPVLIEYIYGSMEEGVKKILEWAALLAGFVIAMGYAFKLMDNVSKKGKAAAILFGVAVGISAAALIAGPILLKEHGVDYGEVTLFAVILGGYVAGMCTILGIAGNFLSQIALGAVAMALIGVLTIGAAYVLKIFYDSIKDIDFMQLLIGIGEMVLVFAAVGAMAFGLGMLVMGPQAAIIAAGAAALAVLEVLIAGASVCMMLIGKSLKVLDSAKNVDFGGIEKVIIGYVKVLKTLVSEMTGLWALKLPLITPVILMSGLALSAVAMAVQSWGSLRVPTDYDNNGKPITFKTMTPEDIDNAAKNIENVLKAIGETIVNVVKDNKDIFEGPLLGLGNSPFEIAVRGFKASGEMLSNVAEGIQNWAMLKVPIGFDKEGKPNGYILMTDKHIKDASNNIMRVLLCIGLSIASVVKDNEELFEGSFGGFGKSPFEIAVKAFTASGKMLSMIAKGIQNWVMLKIPTGFDSKTGEPNGYKVMTPLDLSLAALNIGLVLTTIGNAIVSTVKGNEDIFEGVLGGLGDSPVEVAVRMFTQSGMMLSMIAMGIQNWAAMKVPTGFDKEGKPLGYSNITPLDIALASLHIKKVLLALGKTIADVVDDPNHKYIFYGGENSRALIAARAVNETSQALNNIVQIIKDFSNEDFQKIVQNINAEGGTIDTIKGILGGLVDILNIFLNKAEGTDKGFWGTITGGKTVAEHLNDNKDEIEEAAESIKIFTGTIKSIFESVGKLCKDIKDDIPNLKIITEGTGIQTLRKGLVNLLGIVNGVLIENENILDFLDDNKEKFDVFNSFNEILNNFINSIIRYDDETQNKVEQLGTNIISLYKQVHQIEKSVGFESYVEDTKKFVETINSLDLGKLRHMNDLVASMNELASKLGNIDKLTETLANQVTSVLLELVNQLRKAEAVILNAHELQEKRRKLINESVEKVKKLMNQHMIVEIGRKDESEETPSAPALTNLEKPKENTESSSSESSNMSDVPSPEGPQKANDAEKLKTENGWGGKPLTVDEFVNLMKKNMKLWGSN